MRASNCVLAVKRRTLLGSAREQLPMLFIVSDVQLDTTLDRDDIEVIVHKADGEKCPRCWRVVPVAPESGLCDRCTEATQPSGSVAV